MKANTTQPDTYNSRLTPEQVARYGIHYKPAFSLARLYSHTDGKPMAKPDTQR